ncbi:MAG: thermostable hemolysin [Gammaproteobacteria bacterium]|jgi:hypothetical protein
MHAVQHRQRRSASQPVLVEQSSQRHRTRREIEQFVYDRFAASYGADIRHFLPVLMALRAGDGRIQAVLGMRPAEHDRLFLETYLDRPIEERLAIETGSPVDRASVMEVGNLAVSSKGGGRHLITVLTSYLHASGHQWVVFTIGPVLQNSFRRLGLPLIDLGPANAEDLDARERAAWGSYYAQRPRVMAGRVADGYLVLKELCEMERCLMNLWSQAERIGRLAA